MPRLDVTQRWRDRTTSFCSRRITPFWCWVSWVCSAILFVVIVQLLGGPTFNDAEVSFYATLAIAHGNIACAYPPNFDSIYQIPLTAPVYPLLSGGLAALARVGHNFPFPSASVMGRHCVNALGPIETWSDHRGISQQTLEIGYVSWIVLASGCVGLLRAFGKGLSAREPLALFALALCPPVFAGLEQYFHPQDLIAIGLCLWALAALLKERWAWLGVLLGIAFFSQQFSILVALPLLLLVPSRHKVTALSALVVTAIVIVVPLAILTDGRSLASSFIGTALYPETPGDLLWELHVGNTVAAGLERLCPIVGSVLLTLWAKRRFLDAVLESATLLSLVATALSLRLVFEERVWAYYFLAGAVVLVVRYVLESRVSVAFLGWLVVLIVVFNPISQWADGLQLSQWAEQVITVPPLVMLSAAPLFVGVRAGPRAEPARY